MLFQHDTSPCKVVVRLRDTLVVKMTDALQNHCELDTLTYLREHAAFVPAPRPHGLLTLGYTDLLFMGYIPTQTLEEVWSGLDGREKVAVSTEIDKIFYELRSIRSPEGTAWGHVSGRGCIDRRRVHRVSKKPIHSLNDFEGFLFSNPRFGSDVYINFLRRFAATMECDDRCYFAHGDLRPPNVILKRIESGAIQVSGIVDWESSGWYPAYWESLKMTNTFSSASQSNWYLHLPQSTAPSRYPVFRWLLDLIWDNLVSSVQIPSTS